jgi:hypothetical protein
VFVEGGVGFANIVILLVFCVVEEFFLESRENKKRK